LNPTSHYNCSHSYFGEIKVIFAAFSQMTNFLLRTVFIVVIVVVVVVVFLFVVVVEQL